MSRSSHWIASGIPSDSGLGSKPSSDLALASVPRYVTPAATRSRSATRRQCGTMVAAARTTAAAGRTKEGGTGIGGPLLPPTPDDVCPAGTTDLHGQYVCLGDVGDVCPAVGGPRRHDMHLAE